MYSNSSFPYVQAVPGRKVKDTESPVTHRSVYILRLPSNRAVSPALLSQNCVPSRPTLSLISSGLVSVSWPVNFYPLETGMCPGSVTPFKEVKQVTLNHCNKLGYQVLLLEIPKLNGHKSEKHILYLTLFSQAHRLSTLSLQYEKRLTDEQKGGRKKIKLVSNTVCISLCHPSAL